MEIWKWIERSSWIGVFIGLFGPINLKDIKMTWMENITIWQVILSISVIALIVSRCKAIRDEKISMKKWLTSDIITKTYDDGNQYQGFNQTLEQKINYMIDKKLNKMKL